MMSEYPYPDNRGQTHHEGCYRRPHHHNCAVAEIERLEAELADCKECRRLIERLQAKVDKLEAALEKIISDELYNESQMSVIAEAALKEKK
jgi:hypothetical protein